MMPHHFEFSAPTVAEAVRQAEEELQISREDFHYSVVEGQDDGFVLIQVFPGGKAEHPTQSNVVYKPWVAMSDESEDVQLILSFLNQILGYFEIESDGFFVKEDSETECYIDIQCHQPGILIGKGGVVLEALRSFSGVYMAHQKRKHDLSIPGRTFQIDVQGYFRKRFNNLKRDIDRAVYRAKKNGKDVFLKGEYPPGERRQIHIYARSIPGVITESQGDGFLKPVLIGFRESDER